MWLAGNECSSFKYVLSTFSVLEILSNNLLIPYPFSIFHYTLSIKSLYRDIVCISFRCRRDTGHSDAVSSPRG